MKERLKRLFVRSKETLETKTTTPAFTRLAFYLAVALGLLVLPVGLYFNQTPDRFSAVSIEASLVTQNIRPVVGTRSVATLSRLTASLLNKPGGYLSNDVLPPSVFMDNVPRWELAFWCNVGILPEHFATP